MTVVRHFWTLLFLQRLHSATSSPLYWPYTIPSRRSRCPPLSQNNLSSFQISHLYHHHLSVKRTPKVNIFFSPFLLQRKHSPPPTSIDNRSPTFSQSLSPFLSLPQPPIEPPLSWLQSGGKLPVPFGAFHSFKASGKLTGGAPRMVNSWLSKIHFWNHRPLATPSIFAWDVSV